MKKKLLLVAILLAVIGGSVGYYMYNKPVDKMASLTVSETVTAEKLFQDYEGDEDSANQKYLDKVVVVSGEVVKTSKDGDKATIALDTGDLLANIMCQMEDKNVDLPEDGSQVSIKGLCTGYLTDVVLIKGIIMNN